MGWCINMWHMWLDPSTDVNNHNVKTAVCSLTVWFDVTAYLQSPEESERHLKFLVDTLRDKTKTTVGPSTDPPESLQLVQSSSVSRRHVGSTVANTDPNDSRFCVSPLNEMKPTQQNSVCVKRHLQPLGRLPVRVTPLCSSAVWRETFYERWTMLSMLCWMSAIFFSTWLTLASSNSRHTNSESWERTREREREDITHFINLDSTKKLVQYRVSSSEMGWTCDVVLLSLRRDRDK